MGVDRYSTVVGEYRMMVSKHVNFDFQFLMRDENSYKSSRKWCQSFQALYIQPLLSHGNHHRRVFTHRTPFAEFSLRLTCCKTVEVDLDQKISEVLDSLTGPLLKMEGNSSLHIQRVI